MIDYNKLTIDQKKRYLKIVVEQKFGEGWEYMKIKKGVNHKIKGPLNTGKFAVLFNISDDYEAIWNRNGCIYFNGEWAEPYEEGVLPEKWSDLPDVSGWYVNEYSLLDYYSVVGNDPLYYKCHATLSQVRSSLAYAQLTQLLKEYNKEEDELDWNRVTQKKFAIFREGNELKYCTAYRVYYPIAFLCQNKCKHFLKHHKDLLETFFQIEKQ